MYLGEQLRNPSDARLTLSAQLGVEHLAVEMGRELYDESDTGRWSVARIRHLQERAAVHGITVDVIGLEMGSLLVDIIRGNTERRDAQLDVIAHNIRAAGAAGVPCLKYALHMIGIPRTSRIPGRGGALYAQFNIAEATDEALATYTGASPGQSRAAVVGPVSAQESWDAFTFFLERVIPVAEESGVSLAFHPQDPPLPHEGGLRGFHHVLGSVDGLKRYLDLTASPRHVMNFCQGTVAEMCTEPATQVLDAIRYFGARGKIFMVHFRNIKGSYLNFAEVYPDNGDVDMHQALRIYKDVGYQGMICPDHVPTSAVDPDKERQFAFCLGYIRALMQVVEREA